MKSLLLLALVSTSLLQAEPLISWKRVQLTDKFYAEGANQADINKDGHADIINGPFWYEGPDWKKAHAFYEPKVFDIVGYSDNFFCYSQDFNGDGWLDILVLGFPGKEARLYLSPGQFEKDTSWEMHIVADIVDNESPVFTDITGDGKPEIVCSRKGHFGWYAPNWEKPTEAWPFVPISDDVKVAKFTHGLGVGDVDGDGQMDLMESRRWWQAGVESKTAPWTPHTFSAGGSGGAQIFAYDFDGDGRNDIATALSAHRYGVSVFLNRAGDDGAQWNRRNLVTEQPFDNDYGIVFSQPHAMYLADMDGDGVKDIVTGKRYWAHNGHGDPDEHGPRVVYWFQAKRDGKGGVEFIPHLVDAESGVGVDVQVADVNGDQFPDILVGNKSGVYVLLQQRQEVTAEVAEQSRPKKMYGPALMPNQEYKQGQSPEEAVKGMQLPAGFKAELIAAEPEVVQPIAMCWDERGRLWVVEGNSYPLPREPGAGQDRILILEDADGNGSFETRKVFAEGISLASGIEVGFGGVWVGAAPYMMFIPDVDRDDKPDAADARYADYQKVPGLPFTAYALLDGWGSQDTHETLNSFIWGPDGWLYGCHGVFTHSKVGKPGTLDEQRVPINAGVWRYHPIRHEFEVYAEGSSNPWGLDYDEHGEFFVTACVIPHLYHIVPGGRYQRQAGQHFNPYTYDDIKTIADHAHYAGNLRPGNLDKTTGAGIVSDTTNVLGGGHAHCGLAIYQSSQFPASYRNQLIFGNLHGHRLVTDYLDPKGSTYIGKHGSDFMRSNDTHFIPVTQKVGPDGSLYVSDWSDQQICHRGSKAVENWDRSNGRIYRVSYVDQERLRPAGSLVHPAQDRSQKVTPGTASGGTPDAARGTWALQFPNAPFDLTQETDTTLARLAVQTENEWFARMARRVLMEKTANKEVESDHVIRAIGGQDSFKALMLRYVIGVSAYMLDKNDNPPVRPIRELIALSSDKVEVRAGAIRLLGELQWKLTEDPMIEKDSLEVRVAALVKSAQSDSSAVVRRELASVLQRLPHDQRRGIATALLQHEEDKDDPYIPLLIWYGIEPIVGADAQTGLELAKASKMPKVTEFIYRRLSSDDAGRAALLRALASQGAAFDPAAKEPILSAVLNAARQSGKLSAPADWATIAAGLREAATPPVLSLVQELSALFGDAPALTHYREALADAQQPVNDRLAALAILRQVGDAGTAKVLHDLVTRQDNPSPLRRQGIQALATLVHPETPAVLSALLPKLSPEEQPDAISTLASSSAGAKALLKAVGDKQVPSTALSPFLIRQLQSLNDAEVTTLIHQVWGATNASKADLPEKRAKYLALLSPGALKGADPAKGKMIFSATCGTCHQLFGQGQKVGPELTGSNRANLDYLLDNVLDPNALIGKDYQLNIFAMNDGRVMSGIVKQETAQVYQIAMPGGIEFTLNKAEVKSREIAKVSTMPEGLFDALPPASVLDLVKYLQSDAGGGKAESSGPSAYVPATAPKAAGTLEGEDLHADATGGKVRVQNMGNFKAGHWGGGKHLWWTDAKVGQKLQVTFPVAKGGKQKLQAVFTKAPNYGIVTLKVDGQDSLLGPVDLYDPAVVHTKELLLGEFDLQPGDHTLEVTIQGSNPSAKPAMMFALDYLRVE